MPKNLFRYLFQGLRRALSFPLFLVRFSKSAQTLFKCSALRGSKTIITCQLFIAVFPAPLRGAARLALALCGGCVEWRAESLEKTSRKFMTLLIGCARACMRIAKNRFEFGINIDQLLPLF